MVRSMTGFGRAAALASGREITVEIRAVNHRFFEFSARMPRAYSYLEDKIKKLVQSSVSRGKVDVSVIIQNIDNPTVSVRVNEELAASYLSALRGAGEKFGLDDDLALAAFARFPDIFTVQRLSEDEEEMWNCVSPVAKQALDAFCTMRETEGKRLSHDIISRAEYICELNARVKEQSPKTLEAYRERLFARMQEVLASTDIDQQRILTEAAIFGERIAVDEETVRMDSHLEQLRDILAQGGAVGRKLDFLLQEINREMNTIGSKAQDIDVARIVVDMKSELEKIREQIQNIE